MTTKLKRLADYEVWPRFGTDDGYAVMVDGRIIGYVLRHVQFDTGASRGGRRWVLWSAHDADGKDYDPHGARNTRREAVEQVIAMTTNLTPDGSSPAGTEGTGW